MRNITKRREPHCLTAYRGTPDSNYDDLPSACKKILRERMRAEQGGLCCYCMSRVTAENGIIEHWHPQSKSRDKSDKRDLDYDNMLLSCDGGAHGCGVLHCDASKGNKPLKFNPANSRHNVEPHIRYLVNGRIECSDDEEFNRQIQETLNLNAPHLVAIRAKVIAVTRKRTYRLRAAELSRERKRFSQCNGDGDLPLFCMTVLYFIDKKIRKMTYRKVAGRN